MNVRWRVVLRLLLVPLLWNEFLGVLACMGITIGCLVVMLAEDDPSLLLALIPFGCSVVAVKFSIAFLDRLEKWHPYS